MSALGAPRAKLIRSVAIGAEYKNPVSGRDVERIRAAYEALLEGDNA
jgi:hypothetical protein